jgi:hypothetical protein
MSTVARHSGVKAANAAYCLAFCLLVAFLAVGGRTASAQPASHPVFIGAAAFSTTRPADNSDYHYVTPMLGGTTVGVGGTVGVALGSGLGLATEVTWLGRLSGPFNVDHFIRNYSTATTSEVMLDLLVRFEPGKSRVRVAPVGGLFCTIEHVSLTDRYDPGGYPTYTVTRYPDVSSNNTYLGVGGGVDLVGDLSRRLAITVGVRLAYFPSRLTYPSAGPDGASVGVGRHTYQVGAGLRWTFR